MSKAREITICHANEIREVDLPLESYSPWSHFIIDQGAKATKQNA